MEQLTIRFPSQSPRAKDYRRMKGTEKCYLCYGAKPINAWACDKCRAKNNALRVKRTQRTRQAVIEKYGGKCVCCGLSDWRFLTIDHINNDGASEHGGGRGRPRSFYSNLLKIDRRVDLQVLCANCNCAKFWFGVCPHQISG